LQANKIPRRFGCKQALHQYEKAQNMNKAGDLPPQTTGRIVA
jgi:hypothetical protein